MNLEDVARRANVSIATVSRVVNKVGSVRATTRARVEKAIKELKYYPNLHARSLAGAKSRTLGMIVSNLENPFFLDIFRALEAEALRHGYEVVVANTDYQSRQLVSSVHMMIGRRLTGLAVIVSEMEPLLMQELLESKLRIVFYDVGKPARNIWNIRADYQRGIERTVEYLYMLGHRRMAFVGHHPALAPLQSRREAFLETMKRYSGEVVFSVAADRDGPAGGQQATRQLLHSGFNPTAILCANDYMALGVIRELRDQNYDVPRDVSVTGYDNISLSEFCYPPLTTVDLPREKIGHLVFQLLVPGEFGDEAAGREIVVHPELVVRASTGPARKA